MSDEKDGWAVFISNSYFGWVDIDLVGPSMHVAHAKNIDKETKLLEAGSEYVRYSERDGIAIYRKRK